MATPKKSPKKSVKKSVKKPVKAKEVAKAAAQAVPYLESENAAMPEIPAKKAYKTRREVDKELKETAKKLYEATVAGETAIEAIKKKDAIILKRDQAVAEAQRINSDLLTKFNTLEERKKALEGAHAKSITRLEDKLSDANRLCTNSKENLVTVSAANKSLNAELVEVKVELLKYKTTIRTLKSKISDFVVKGWWGRVFMGSDAVETFLSE